MKKKDRYEFLIFGNGPRWIPNQKTYFLDEKIGENSLNFKFGREELIFGGYCLKTKIKENQKLG